MTALPVKFEGTSDWVMVRLTTYTVLPSYGHGIASGPSQNWSTCWNVLRPMRTASTESMNAAKP